MLLLICGRKDWEQEYYICNLVVLEMALMFQENDHNPTCLEKPPVFISVEGCMGVLEELGRHILWVITGIFSNGEGCCASSK